MPPGEGGGPAPYSGRVTGHVQCRSVTFGWEPRNGRARARGRRSAVVALSRSCASTPSASGVGGVVPGAVTGTSVTGPILAGLPVARFANPPGAAGSEEEGPALVEWPGTGLAGPPGRGSAVLMGGLSGDRATPVRQPERSRVPVAADPCAAWGRPSPGRAPESRRPGTSAPDQRAPG